MSALAARSYLRVALLAAAWFAGRAEAAPAGNLRLPKDRDSFFVEDDLAYRRYLRLGRDGTYRQLDQDATATLEVDRGTWVQDPQAAVLLHSTNRGLRFRALRSGPLTVTLGSTEQMDALPGLAADIRRFLTDSGAAVFTPGSATDLGAPPAVVTVDRAAESFAREDLSRLLEQIEQTLATEQTRTYRLAPLRLPGGGPLLLVLQGAIFGAEQAVAVSREYHVPRGKAPPFYFAQTDATTFERKAGVYRSLESQWPPIDVAAGQTSPP